MIEGHIIFNAILYSIVIAYILYINFSAYYQTGTGFLKALVNLFQNWIFRTVYLLIVGFFALDLFPYGGFVLAILLTIAFLNTNMLMYKKDVEESFTAAAVKEEEEQKLKLPRDIPIQQQQQQQQTALPTTVQQQGSVIPPPQPPSSVGSQSNTSMYTPPAPQQGQNQQMMPSTTPQTQVVQQNPQPIPGQQQMPPRSQ